MELMRDILVRALQSEEMEVRVVFPNDSKLENLFENECYGLLMKIRAVIDDHDLTDSECYDKIEEIMELFDELRGA